MKPFLINRNSWHYKLNKHFFNEDGITGYRMQERWEPRHNDFCSYWRATIFRLIAAVILAAFIFSLIFGLGLAAYTHPYETLRVAATVVGLFGVVIGVIVAMSYFESSKKKLDKSLFVQKYRAHKSKICPMVEYGK